MRETNGSGLGRRKFSAVEKLRIVLANSHVSGLNIQFAVSEFNT